MYNKLYDHYLNGSLPTLAGNSVNPKHIIIISSINDFSGWMYSLKQIIQNSVCFVVMGNL